MSLMAMNLVGLRGAVLGLWRWWRHLKMLPLALSLCWSLMHDRLEYNVFYDHVSFRAEQIVFDQSWNVHHVVVLLELLVAIHAVLVLISVGQVLMCIWTNKVNWLELVRGLNSPVSVVVVGLGNVFLGLNMCCDGRSLQLR